MKYDFSGWATKNGLRCADGRTIMRDAFKADDGQVVPLVWNHQHNDAENVLGHALLENRPEGVYTYGVFNDTEQGQNAKMLVQHGDITGLSIFANQLKQNGGNVLHGAIREVSLVLAGANPGAYIEDVIVHGETSEQEAVIYTGENICGGKDNMDDNELQHAQESEETVADVFNTLSEKQKTVVYALIGQALEDNEDDDDDEGDDDDMKHNLFDEDYYEPDTYLSHADQAEIIGMAKTSSCGSLRDAISTYMNENATLSHAFDADDLDELFPDYHDMMTGAPEAIPEDSAWISDVMGKVHKSPYARIRTRQADITGLRALAYNTKGAKKKDMGNVKLVSRTTDPQTVYVKDKLNRDDIIDITDFDVVAYQWSLMKGALNEELATAILIGDGREEGDEDKIYPDHIRPIWQDDELYTIHTDVDVAAARKELQGTETGAHFGDNYVYAEAIVTASLYAREKYKGRGALTFYCTPHLLNVMLLARDMNGRRIYQSKSDLAAALNVGAIHTIEKLEDKTRKTSDMEPKTKKLLGLFVNLADYNVGCVKKGEIAQFSQFDIDFNQEKFLIETRLSGALTRVKSAIALEEDVTPGK